MLAQVARRRSQRDARRLSRVADQLYLPWLCPALFRGNASLGPIARDPGNRVAQHKSRTAASSRSRTLATAAAAEALNETKAPHIFDQMPQGHLSRARGSQTSDDSMPLSTWKDARPLVIHTATTAPPPRLNYFNGIGGDPVELHSNLQACLRVGRLDRAAALLRRLRELYNPTAPELVESNNMYLLQLMDRVWAKQPGYTMNTMSSWFEHEMRDNDIPPNSVTYTCMLRTAILILDGAKRERLIRRYLWLAEQSGELNSVLTNEAWSDDEYSILADVRPDLIGEELPADSEGPERAELFGETVPRPALSNDFIPELRPMEQKGAGLRTVKAALSIFSNPEELEKALPYPHDLPGYTKEEKDHIYARMRQDRLEEDTVDAAIDRWREEHQNMQKMGITSALQTKPMEALMWQWYSAMVPLFKQELENVKTVYERTDAMSGNAEQAVTGPFLEAFTPEKLAATSLIVTISNFSAPDQFNGIKVANLAMAIGKQLAMEHSLMVAQSVQSNLSIYKTTSARRLRTLLKYSKTVDPNQTKPSEDTQDGEDVSKNYERLNDLEWAPAIKAKVGALCLSKILEAAKIPITREEKETRRQLTATEPAFHHATTYVSGRRAGVVRVHEKVLEKLRREPLRGSFGTKYPMVVEPLPWTGYRKGGFFRYPEPIIKEKRSDDAQRIYAQAAIEKGDMDQVLTGLSVLGKTPWKLNRDVFKVVVEAWNTGEPVAGIAPENPKIECPPEPGENATRKQIAQWLAEKKTVDNAKSGYHSQRCFQNFQLEVARAFKDEIFYFPHNMDFRGRAYPIPPLLNHLGADLARGLLTFGKGKELGAVGLSWLKIHLANVFGYDKASLKDREAFAMEHIQDIYDCCEKPLTGRRWWLQAEDPWQCLATCFELKHALDSPDPSKYVSHLPVHQDGTCNGLQHYAALGGDKAGAAQVNLEPGDKPSDIYSAVAGLVKNYVANDAKTGHKFAGILDGKITRKVVKQTVMTNVYGVTFTGARLQVIKQLEDILSDAEKKVGLFQMGGYVAKLIFQALGQMFNGAQDIQEWLGACANRIATALTPEQIDMIAEATSTPGASIEPVPDPRYRQRKSQSRKKKTLTRADIMSQFRATVIWTTPLKMPVVQPYRRTATREITTVLQYLTIVQPQTSDTVDKRKQLQAFPPNFIHSLDATHMLLSALKCNEIGLSFASVHDSFWTHAADVPLMNRVLRDAFVRMHSEDIVGRLHEEFSIRYRDCMYLASIPSKSPLGQRIIALRRDAAIAKRRESRLGLALIDELLAERERQRLLNSEDEEERARGRAMSTPASLYEAAGGDELVGVQMGIDEEVHVTRLGDTADDAVKPASRGTKKKNAAAGAAAAAPTTKDIFEDDSDAMAEETSRDDDDDDAELLEAIMGEEHSSAEDADTAEEQRSRKPRQAQRSRINFVKIWLPVQFPDVPKKGDFDVRRLKDSTYFFS
ncbi:dna-directed rna polymerase [Diplodia corticola]|uniref:DNA-directed RNA polymerase n=1 Tax=Diplodia corticola TaxID=236234 RepID=A0A1J9RGZ4_9PEZI|nr:dna-directed rna polymerase [Diplodia corticola]OJD40830.1 dna-directed rna polymerase [Diplodia corticola]